MDVKRRELAAPSVAAPRKDGPSVAAPSVAAPRKDGPSEAGRIVAVIYIRLAIAAKVRK